MHNYLKSDSHNQFNKNNNKAYNNANNINVNNFKTKIIVVSNQKGGVGKTTTVSSLATSLSLLNKTCLLIDLDPQGNLSTIMGIDYEARKNNIYNVLCSSITIQNAILSTANKNVDIITANMDLIAFNTENINNFQKEYILKNILIKFLNLQKFKCYDYILIDCSPALNLLSVNALTCADYVIIPMQAEYLSLEGLVQLMHTIKLIQDNYNKELDLLGILITMFDKRSNLAKLVIKEVQEFLKDSVFKSIIPRTVKISEAQSYSQTILNYDSSSIAAIEYLNFAKEIINRINSSN
ncbi:MAG: ParA family protein [Rickettsiales bacterium]